MNEALRHIKPSNMLTLSHENAAALDTSFLMDCRRCTVLSIPLAFRTGCPIWKYIPLQLAV